MNNSYTLSITGYTLFSDLYNEYEKSSKIINDLENNVSYLEQITNINDKFKSYNFGDKIDYCISTIKSYNETIQNINISSYGEIISYVDNENDSLNTKIITLEDSVNNTTNMITGVEDSLSTCYNTIIDTTNSLNKFKTKLDNAFSIKCYTHNTTKYSAAINFYLGENGVISYYQTNKMIVFNDVDDFGLTMKNGNFDISNTDLILNNFCPKNLPNFDILRYGLFILFI